MYESLFQSLFCLPGGSGFLLYRCRPVASGQIKEIPSEEGLGIAKSPEGPKLDPHF